MKENEIHTIVGSDVKLTGTIKDTNDIVVHGNIEGEVLSEQNVVVEEHAKVKGPVTAQAVSVSGEIEGTVKAFDKLEIHPSGQVKGNIQTKDLIIHSGARFIGKSDMVSDGGRVDAEDAGPAIEEGEEEQSTEQNSNDDESVVVEVDEES